MTSEQLRRRHEPERVRLLFIGESPPASGRFFYARNSGLYRAMVDVFATVDSSIDEEAFLGAFQASGCYLLDLCTQPVDHLPPQQRREKCKGSETLLARSITQLRPEMIATLLRSVEGHVVNAIEQARWQGPMINLPYPGRWQHLKGQFSEALKPVIVNLLSNRPLRVINLPVEMKSPTGSSLPCPRAFQSPRKATARRRHRES